MEEKERMGMPEIFICGLKAAVKAVLEDFEEYSPQDRLAAIQVAEKWEREIGYWEQQEAASDGL